MLKSERECKRTILCTFNNTSHKIQQLTDWLGIYFVLMSCVTLNTKHNRQDSSALNCLLSQYCLLQYKGKGSPYSITECRVLELILVLGSQPAGDVSHKPGGRLPLLSARPTVTPTTLKRAATNFAAWWTEAQWVWTVCLRLLPSSVATAIWTRALLRLSPAH